MSADNRNSRNERQAGFGHVVTVLVVVLVFATIGFIGYKLYANPIKEDAVAPVTGQTVTTPDVPAAPEIKSASDLDDAATALDAVDPGNTSKSDQASLDNQLSGL